MKATTATAFFAGFTIMWEIHEEQNGLAMDQAPVLRVTHAQYKCPCGEEWEAILNTVPTRDHWLACECKRMVWPWKVDLPKKMDGPPPIRLVK
jgi:hypothetical protein